MLNWLKAAPARAGHRLTMLRFALARLVLYRVVARPESPEEAERVISVMREKIARLERSGEEGRQAEANLQAELNALRIDHAVSKATLEVRVAEIRELTAVVNKNHERVMAETREWVSKHQPRPQAEYQ